MITHEQDIQDIVCTDREILDVVLERQLRDFYKEHRLAFPEYFKQILLNIAWANYSKWN